MEPYRVDRVDRAHSNGIYAHVFAAAVHEIINTQGEIVSNGADIGT